MHAHHTVLIAILHLLAPEQSPRDPWYEDDEDVVTWSDIFQVLRDAYMELRLFYLVYFALQALAFLTIGWAVEASAL